MHSNPYEDTDAELIVHMTPAEINELSNLQGGKHIDQHRNIPTFTRLGEIITQNQLIPQLHSTMREHHANGGNVEGFAEDLRRSGRMGDTQIAVLPRFMGDIFDQYLNNGRPCINPTTGKREYFLGGLFSGIKNVFNSVKPMASNFLNSVTPMASQAINAVRPIAGQALKAFSPQIGAMAAQGINAIGQRYGMQNAANMISPVVNSTISGLANNAGDMIANNSFNPQALAQNASRDASGAIANQMPQNSPVGAGLNAYYQGASPAHAGFTAARTYASQAQNPYLAQAGNAGIDAMQNYYNTFNS